VKKIFSQIKAKVLKSLNLKQFGFFLLAAFIFLMLSKLSESSVEEVTFKIQIKNLPNDIQLKQDSSSSITAKVKSSGFGFLPLSFGGDVPVTLDAEEDLRRLKNHRYLWALGSGFQNLQLKVPESLEIITTKADSIFFPFEVLSSKKVPIQLNSDIDFALGFDMLKTLELSQDSVLAIGPIKILDSISVIETQLLQLKKVKTSIDRYVPLMQPKDEAISLNRDKVHVFGKVERFTEGSVVVPIELVNVPAGAQINYFPKNITLSFYVSLEDYKTISSNDFQVICDFQETEDRGETYLRPRITSKSDLVKSVRANINKVDFIFL